jgi:(p)ppGpp synthase/HD superfamily hydrolase
VSKFSNFFRKKTKNIELLWISLADKLKTITEIEVPDESIKSENNNGETLDSSKPNNENGKINSYNFLLNEMNE